MAPSRPLGGLLGASGRLWAAFGCRSRFWSDFGLYVGPLLGLKIDRKWSPSALKIRAPSVEAIFGHLKASWGGFELEFGLILKAFFAAPGEA